MNLFIPDIGTQLRLTSDWTFHLCFERRNQRFGEKFGVQPPPPENHRGGWGRGAGWWQPERAVLHTLPAGTILKVDRIYIRKGAAHYGGGSLSKFSSLTFYATLPPTGKSKKGKGVGRFWAKLADVNTIECEIIEE